MTRPTMHRHTPLQALERRVAHLEALLATKGIRPQTIEQCVMSYLQRYAAGSPTDVRTWASLELGLSFKPTSISAVMCKMVRMGLIRKAERHARGYHSYKLKGAARGTRKSS